MIDSMQKLVLFGILRLMIATAVASTLIASASASVDGTYNPADGYTNVQSLYFRLDNGNVVHDPGTLAWRVDASGNVFVAYVQPLSINDNTYGTGSIGWGSKTHTMNDLTGSDKAHFDFTNGAGQAVLSFNLDYISVVQVNHVNTFRSLGVTGGDGSISLGNASSLLQWNTSLAYNMNTLGFHQYTTNSPAATAQLDAHGNIDYSRPYLNSAAPGWDYSITCEVMISSAAFGPSGFGGVSVPYAHDSPSKFGQNTIPVVPIPEPASYLSGLAVVALIVGTQARAVLKKRRAKSNL